MQQCEGASKLRRLLNPIVAVAGAAAVVVPTWVWAQAPSGAVDYDYGPHHMMWGFGMIFGPLFLILVLALVIAVAVLVVRWFAGPWHGAAQPVPGRTPLDILRERFARGEIDKDEFEERRRVLGD
jgi:putative membrane protein